MVRGMLTSFGIAAVRIVCRLCRNAGHAEIMKSAMHRASSQIKDEALILYDMGWTPQEIGAKFDFHERTVRRWINPKQAESHKDNCRKWYRDNKDFVKQRTYLWRKENPQKYQEINRRARDKARNKYHEDPSFVYVIWFPAAAIVKIGTSKRMPAALRKAKIRMHSQKYFSEDAKIIWKRAGHLHEEAYLQVHLAFEFRSTFGDSYNLTRLSEWFEVTDFSEEEITSLMDSFYLSMPNRKWV